MIERCDVCREKHKHEVEEMTKEERDDYINSIADGLKDLCDIIEEACDHMKSENYIAAALSLGEGKRMSSKYYMELNL